MNQGKVILNLSGDFRHKLDIDYDYQYNCQEYGCDLDGICRCGVITNAKLRAVSPYDALSLAQTFFDEGTGPDRNFEFVLAVKFLKHLFADVDEYFEIRTCSGYYGEEIEGIYAEPGTEQFLQKKCDIFNCMTNPERLKFVLEMEYGYVLPEVLKYSNWQLKNIPIEDVQAGKEILAKTSKEVKDNYEMFCPWSIHGQRWWTKVNGWFPGVVVVPNGNNKYRLIDGFHRFSTWTTKPHWITTEKWKRLRTNKKITVIAPIE